MNPGLNPPNWTGIRSLSRTLGLWSLVFSYHGQLGSSDKSKEARERDNGRVREGKIRRGSGSESLTFAVTFVAVVAGLGPLEREPWLEGVRDVGRGPRVRYGWGPHGRRPPMAGVRLSGSCRMRTSLNLTSTHGSMCADERRSTHQFLAPVIDTHWWRQVTGI